MFSSQMPVAHPDAAASPFVFWVRLVLVTGSALGAFLVGLTIVRYPASVQQTLLYWLALGLLVGCGAFALLSLHPPQPGRTASLTRLNVPAILRLGVGFGLLVGSLWIIEIVTGNLGATSTSLGVLVYRGATLLAFFLPVVAGAVAAYQLASIRAGILVGFWSGFVSGLMGFLTLMGIALLFLPRLEQDPQTLQEYTHSTERTLATFIAGDFLFAACSHLLLVGLVYGTGFATVGALLGRFLGRAFGASAVARKTPPRPAEHDA